MRRMLVVVLLLGGCARSVARYDTMPRPLNPPKDFEHTVHLPVTTRPLSIKGTGVVVGLDHTGDCPLGESAQMLRRILGGEYNKLIGSLHFHTAAVVTVTGVVPAGSKPGDPFHVRVVAVGDAKSLEGGMLYLAALHYVDPGQPLPLVVASAQGRIRYDMDHHTTGIVEGGGMLERVID